jgi:membrane protein YqaA with SNARE-associated domain
MLIQFLAQIFSFLKSYGYTGIFLINLIASSTIIIPLPAAVFVFSFGSILNPFLVGVLAGVGSAIGELTGYALGIGGREILRGKWKKQIIKVEKLFEKYGGFLIIFVFAATPLPDDIVGIAGGVMKYPVKKFFVASLLGKIVLNLALAYAGFYGVNWILQYFG